MRIAFIASEYNPFHNGHKYLIEKAKEAGFDIIVAVMSGNFVQRGEPACADKFTRAHAAVLGGADLVIELPLKYAVSTASYFAKGFIDTVNATGLSGAIAFGASAEKDELLNLKDIIFSESCQKFTEAKIAEGLSYPTAKYQYIKEYFPSANYDILNDANNILALEYINAIEKSSSLLDIFCVKRVGAAHDSDLTYDNFSSAGYIRRKIAENISLDKIKQYLPEKVFNLYSDAFCIGKFPASMKAFNIASFSRLIDFDAEYFRKVNNVTGGIENRIVDAVKNSNNISELYDKIKSRHYTHSRIRQIILSAVLGIRKTDLDTGVSFIRVLAFNDKGKNVLHHMKKTAKLPLISNLSQANLSDEIINRDIALDYKAGKFYNLCINTQNSANPEYNMHPIYIKTDSI